MEDGQAVRRHDQARKSAAERPEVMALLEQIADQLITAERSQGAGEAAPDHGSIDPDNPWDRASADALADVYWGYRQAAAPAPAVLTRPPVVETSAVAPREFSDLRHQLSRLEQRLERGLFSVDPATTLRDLQQRMQTIEASLAEKKDAGPALAEGLKAIDQDIAALSQAIEAVSGKAGRVEAVERGVQALAKGLDTRLSQPTKAPLLDADIEKMSKAVVALLDAKPQVRAAVDLTPAAVEMVTKQVSEVVAKAMPAPQPVQHTDEDLKRVAESIGRVLVQRVGKALETAPKADDAGTIELRKLMEVHIQERRESDEHMAGVLDTMQQALLGLLDRMDALDKAGEAAADAHVAPLAATAEYEPPSSAPALPPSMGPAVANAAEPERPRLPGDPAPTAPGIPAMTLPGSAPAAPSKEDLIASARRAAAQAQAQAQAQAAPTGKDAKAAARASKPKAKSSGSPLLNRKVLLALLAVVTAASAYMALSRKPARAPQPPAATEQPATPKAQSSNPAGPAQKIAMSGDGAEIVDAVEEPADTAAPGSHGTVAQQSRPMSPLDMLRQQEQEGIARISARMGYTPVETASAQMPVAAQNPIAAAREMPPALVGPNSLRLAAQAGDPSAEFTVASRLGEGRGVPQDIEEAARWYQRSAQQGFALSQYRLGTYYERGLGVTRDVGRAQAWYQRAAEQGNVKAMHNLAVILAGRDNGGPDYTRAAQWFQKAADHGLRDSLFNLAILHESGLGVEQDFAKAYKYLALAAQAGDQQAVKRLQQIRSRLAAPDAQRIDDEVSRWRSRPMDRMANDPVAAGEAWKTRGEQQSG